MSEKNTFDETPKETLNNDDIELSAELNPDIYFKDKSENIKDNQFITMKSEGAISGFFDWIRCIIFAISFTLKSSK